MAETLNIVARTNGVGLDQDVEIIRRAAGAAGFEVTVSHCRAILPFAHCLAPHFVGLRSHNKSNHRQPYLFAAVLICTLPTR